MLSTDKSVPAETPPGAADVITMQARINAETSQIVELTVEDRANTTHDLDITRDGTVRRHHIRGRSADVANQSRDEAEQLRQVQRFAKYYLFRQRGYETLTPYDGTDRIAYPERVAAAALIIGAMSLETFESQFEAAYHQRKRPTPADCPPVQPPGDSQETTCTRIEQDIYLTVDDDLLRSLQDVLVELEALGALRQLMDRRPDKEDEHLFDRLASIFSRSDGLAASSPARPTGEIPFIRGTSPLRVHWQIDGATRVEYGSGGESPNAPIACRLQLPMTTQPVTSVAAFQRLVLDHLICQLRDCYVGMGLAPPRDLRVRGQGIAAFSTEFADGETYQRYDDPKAIIDWDRLAPLPSL